MGIVIAASTLLVLQWRLISAGFINRVCLHPGGEEIDLGIEIQLVIETQLLNRDGEHPQRLGDEVEGSVGENEAVLVGVEEEGQAAVMFLDDFLGDAEEGAQVLHVIILVCPSATSTFSFWKLKENKRHGPN